MKSKKILLLALLILLVLLFFHLDLHLLLSLESLKRNGSRLIRYYESHKVGMVAGFMVVYVLQTALSLPGAAILSLAAGAVFGSAMGTIYAITAATTGATLAFLASRYLFRDYIQSRFGEKLEKLNRELEVRGLHYLLFLRIVPLFPFFLINLAAGLTRLPLRVFFFGTLLGIIPGGFVFVNAGASLATINTLGDIASPRVLWSFTLLGCFVLVPALYHKSKRC